MRQFSIATLLKLQVAAAILCWLYPFGVERVWYQDYAPASGWIVKFKTGEIFGELWQKQQLTLFAGNDNVWECFWINNPYNENLFSYSNPRAAAYFGKMWLPRVPWLMAGSMGIGFWVGRRWRKTAGRENPCPPCLPCTDSPAAANCQDKS